MQPCVAAAFAGYFTTGDRPMKKILVLIISLIMIMVMIPASTGAAATYGISGGGVGPYWQVDTDSGLLRVWYGDASNEGYAQSEWGWLNYSNSFNGLKNRNFKDVI